MHYTPKKNLKVQLLRHRNSLLWANIATLILLFLFYLSSPVQAQDLPYPQLNEPEMVQIPGGTFKMGCTLQPCRDHAQPIHTVSINSFLLSKYEITFSQWDSCVFAGGCRHIPSDNGWGRGNNPVINVSWDDAQAFVTWINRTTGKTYILPSEEEWEYAARAGTETKYPWGDQIGLNLANCTGCLAETDRKAITVGSFPPNPYGLHDMQGNVYEMTRDCWSDGYSKSDTAPPTSDKHPCYQRVTRGGAWSSAPEALISGNRFSVTSFR